MDYSLLKIAKRGILSNYFFYFIIKNLLDFRKNFPLNIENWTGESRSAEDFGVFRGLPFFMEKL